MRSVFTKLNKPELDFLADNCNFSDEEKEILNMSSLDETEIHISSKLSISESTVRRRKRKIKGKIKDFIFLADNLDNSKNMKIICNIILKKLEL